VEVFSDAKIFVTSASVVACRFTSWTLSCGAPRTAGQLWTLDAMLAAVLARSTRHLVTLVAELEALGVDLVVTDQAIDTTTPAGRLLFHMLGAIAEFERDLIVDRVRAGVARARAQGKHLGRPRVHRIDAERARELLAQGLSLRAVARSFKVHPMVIHRALAVA
jgi:DNA invertase Pin-like site-specific DNA recombinase